MRLKRECDQFAMPIMVEPLVFRPNSEAGGYMVDGDLTKIMHLVRQAVELGADVIKADHRVVERAGGIPVLVRGGGKVSDREIIERTFALLGQGISGLVYGRNVIQHQICKKSRRLYSLCSMRTQRPIRHLLWSSVNAHRFPKLEKN